MWGPLRRLFAPSKSFKAPFGDVVFESEVVRGQAASSQFQWQVKRGLDEKSYYVCIRMRADGSIGPEGSPTNYISFDLPTALKIRADIDECIAIVRHFASPDGAAIDMTRVGGGTASVEK